LLKDFFALCGKLYRQHSYLPPVITASHFGSCGSSEDLMTETYTDNADAVLFEQLFCEVDKLQDPRIVVEGVVFWRTSINLVLDVNEVEEV
jgi:hypothetical protein